MVKDAAEPKAEAEEMELVRQESERLRRQAKRWGVEIPHDVLFEDGDGAHVIGGAYHTRMALQIQQARREKIKFLFWWVGPLGGIVGVLAFFVARVPRAESDVPRLQTARSCAEAADRFYRARYTDEGPVDDRLNLTLGSSLTRNKGNHYNSELHRCLIRVLIMDSVVTEDEIRDAVETTSVALEFTATTHVDDTSDKTKKEVTFKKFGQEQPSSHNAFQAWMAELMTK